MNDHPTPFFADSFEETVITAEVIESENPKKDTAGIERLDDRNRALIATIARLEGELSEMKDLLEARTRRLRNYEALLARQTEELNHERQRLQRSIAEVESYREVERRQKRSLITLSDELTTLRQQLARLERECTLLQEEDNEKTQHLIVARRQVDELHSRLQRQQRYTLEYKAALDRCLEEKTGPLPATDLAIVPGNPSIEPWSEENTREEKSEIVPRNEEPIDDDIDELLAEFERIDSLDPSSRRTADWPSPLISPYTPKSPAPRIDLPTFLKNRPESL